MVNGTANHLLSVSLLLVLLAMPSSLASVVDPSRDNARRRTDLVWFFGGREQHGWGIYVPLIASLVGTDPDRDPVGFARAIRRWQKQNQLIPTGVLDQETWMAMIGGWQEKRLRRLESWFSGLSGSSLPLDLVTAESSEFYDPERPPELRQLERETYLAYRRMYKAAQAPLGLGPGSLFLKIISAYRTREYQEMLRMKEPNSGSAGLAVNSPHLTGRALDLYVGGEPVISKDHNRALQTTTPAYKWLVKNAKSFGFEPYFFEPWHWEYVQDKQNERR